MVDDAWQTRIPQGWIQFPDGSIGPPNQVGSDWNAPYRSFPGANAPTPAPPAPGGTLPGGTMPGGQVLGRTATTPGQPSMGNPALQSPFAGGPEIYPPQNSTIPSGKQVGAWTNPFSDAYINPATGQPEYVGGPNATIGPRGGGGGFNFPNIVKLFGGSNPYVRGAIAAAGIMEPTPAETGELSPRFFTGQGVQPGLSAPQGTPYEVPRGMPGRAVDAPQTYPHMPWPDTGAATPSPTPRGARVRIPPNAVGIAPPNAAPPSSMFTTVDRPNANPGIGGGMLGGALASPRGQGGAPLATALDLSHLFGGGQPAEAPKINVGKIPNKIPATRGVAMTNKAPSDYGPLQRNRRWKLENPDYYR